MRATFRNLLEAKRREREETGEAGFSLIELIIVIVIIGILAAIAIPIFANIQKSANDSAGQAAAANAATSAAIIASQPGATNGTITDATSPSYVKLKKGAVSDIAISITGTDLTTLCATATITGGTYVSWSSGPGCTADHGAAS